MSNMKINVSGSKSIELHIIPPQTDFTKPEEETLQTPPLPLYALPQHLYIFINGVVVVVFCLRYIYFIYGSI